MSDKSLRVDISKWQKRNLWPLRSGELAVRPGLRQIKAAETGRTNCGGFSVLNARTAEVWHYIVDVNSTGADATLRVYDENFVLLQSLAGLSARVPRDVTWGVVGDQLIIGSPDFPMLVGIVGSAVGPAVGEPGNIPGRVLLPPPRGLTVSWAGRAVVAGTDFLSISDGLFPTTFDPINTANPPGGQIFGMHVTHGGALVLCTTTGVWGLPEDAATSGQQVTFVFSKLSDHSTTSFGSTCTSLGALWGLTDKGYRRIDTENGEEVPLDELRTGGVFGLTPIMFPTYKTGRAHPGQVGPVLSIDRFTHMTDKTTGVESWWNCADEFSTYPLQTVGVLQEADGSQPFITPLGVIRLDGSQDPDGGDVEGSLYGSVPMSPELSRTTRRIDVATDSIDLRVSLNHETRTFAVPQVHPIIDTDVWGANPYREAAFRSRGATFAQRTDNIAIEVRAKYALSRLGNQLTIEMKGPGRTRRTG